MVTFHFYCKKVRVLQLLFHAAQSLFHSGRKSADSERGATAEGGVVPRRGREKETKTPRGRGGDAEPANKRRKQAARNSIQLQLRYIYSSVAGSDFQSESNKYPLIVVRRAESWIELPPPCTFVYNYRSCLPRLDRMNVCRSDNAKVGHRIVLANKNRSSIFRAQT